MRAHLASLVEEFLSHADEIAVVAHRGIRRYHTTYGEVALLAGRFATELDRRAIAPGERVVLWGANSAEWISAFFGCLLRGVIAVPLDATGSPDFASRVVKDVAPRLIVGDHALMHSLNGTQEIPTLAFADLATQLPAEPNYIVSESVTRNTPFQIVFTSGTTSEPKGIVHTHANVLSSVAPIEHEMKKYRKYERWIHPLRFLHTLPLSHVFGQFMGLWLPPLIAGEVHFVDQVEARRMTDLIHRERVSVLVAVPRILQLLRTHLLSRFDSLTAKVERAPTKQPLLKRWWRFRKVHSALGWKFWAVISGGAALPEELEHFWNAIGVALIQGYGMTETTALVTLNHPFKIAEGTIGRTLPGREVRLSDEGEILVRGDMLATATWQSGSMRQREGEWLATGDLGEKTEDGDLRFVGRKGDVIVTGGGMNVHPDDLESAMKKQPGIRDCAVVPCGTASGIEPVAVVLLSGTDTQLHEAVIAANRELADYQQIRRVLKWPELQFPFTSTGKLLRRKITDWVCQGIQNQQTPGPHSAQTGSDIVLDMIAEVTGERSQETGDQLRLTEDLHLDSLGRVQLQTALEQRLNIELTDDALAGAETLGDLRKILAEHAAPGAVAAAIDGTSSKAATTPSSTQQPSSQSGITVATAPPASSAQPQASAESTPKPSAGEHLYPYWPWRWPFVITRIAFLELVMRPVAWLLTAPRIVRKFGTLPDRPMLVICNHVSAFDGALVLYGLPGKLRRHTAIAMSGEMLLDFRFARNQGNFLLDLTGPPQYWLVTWLFNVFPLPRLQGFRRSFAHAGEAMDRGYNVMVFPEGTVHRDGLTHTFRQGIGLLAEEARVPILPVALAGLDEMRKSRWFRSGKLEIRIGEPIPFDDEASPAELTARLEEAIRDLLA